MRSNTVHEYGRELCESHRLKTGGLPTNDIAIDSKTLHAKIEELTLENFFPVRPPGGIVEWKEMIDRAHKKSVVRQAKLPSFSRGSVYYSLLPVLDGDLALMRRINKMHLDCPFAESRIVHGLLKAEGCKPYGCMLPRYEKDGR